MKRLFLLCAAPILFTGACATTDNAGDSGSIPAAQREYKTGSNIPKRAEDPSQATVYDKESVERERERINSQPPPRSPR